MKIYSQQEVDAMLLRSAGGVVEKDNDGQLVIYTGLYWWDSDQTIRNEPEPQCACEDEDTTECERHAEG